MHLPGPSEEPSWYTSGSCSLERKGQILGVALTPMGLLHRAPTLCVSMCGACEHLTDSNAWSPGQEARDLGPGNDPRMSPKSLPTCCRAFSTLLSKPPSEDFPRCLGLPLHPCFPEASTQSSHSFLKMSAVMAIACLTFRNVSSFLHRFFISSWRIPILHRLLGRVSGTGYRTIQCPPPCLPEPLELDPTELSVWWMQFHSDPCVS